MSQVLDPAGEATGGKTYTLVSWLPSVRVSGTPRPHSKLGEDAVTIALAAYTLVALFWDGLHHNNITGEDQFFSPPHIAMYLGLVAVGVWIALVLLRYQKDLDDLDWSLVPRGYGLAFIALPLAAIAGPADFMWHQAYGFENQIDSTFSPSHQGLFYAGAMLATIAAAAAWQRRDMVTPSLREFLPAAFSATSLIAVMLFVVHQMLPFYGGAGVTATQDFQDDIVGRAEAFAPGADAHHIEGLSKALTHYGDDAFPYYFFSTHASVGGILLFTAALMGAILMMRRRFRIPPGTLTITLTFLALLWPMLSEYREAELIPVLVLTGVVGDLLLVRVGDGRRVGHLRLFAGALPVVMWSLFFLDIAVLNGGLGWEPTLWFGLLVTTAGLGYAISLLVFPPYSRMESN